MSAKSATKTSMTTTILSNTTKLMKIPTPSIVQKMKIMWTKITSTTGTTSKTLITSVKLLLSSKKKIFYNIARFYEKSTKNIFTAFLVEINSPYSLVALFNRAVDFGKQG